MTIDTIINEILKDEVYRSRLTSTMHNMVESVISQLDTGDLSYIIAEKIGDSVTERLKPEIDELYEKHKKEIEDTIRGIK